MQQSEAFSQCGICTVGGMIFEHPNSTAGHPARYWMHRSRAEHGITQAYTAITSKGLSAVEIVDYFFRSS